ncbi:MAG: hypothetical protein JNL52_07240 [Flavobacteriales bacterium]|nr:hypothetical protein [Flavobacteriales bacterium]
MRTFLLSLFSALTVLTATAQYGSFDAAAVKAAKATTTIVVLDDGDSPYNRTIMDAMKVNWKFTGNLEFVKVSELAAQPITPDKTYLLKTAKVDPVKFEATFLALVKGWKQKKGETLQQKDNAFTSIPSEHELAFIMMDPKAINANENTAMLTVYVKHLQDYLKQVEGGKITDKATADRLYAGRTRLIRDTELHIGQAHLDKSLTDLAKVQESYTAPVKLEPVKVMMQAVEAQDRTITVTDVLLTGDYKTKHCFKRIFNAGTGELMYQGDDAALAGKKEGILAQDLLNVMRAR